MTDGPMDRLWAPWRMQYVGDSAPRPGCVLCQKHEETDDAANLVVYRGAGVYVLLNLYPYNTGHVMVTPYAHVARLADLTPAVRAELMDVASLAADVLTDALNPAGFNVGMNLGKVAGAGIADHVHLHLVPRWDGDTNFMPVIANTKVMPETLDQTYRKIVAAFARRRG